MFDASKYYSNNDDSYYDGIPPEVSAYHATLTLEELEAEIEEERKRCEEMTEW